MKTKNYWDWHDGNKHHIEVPGCIVNITTGLQDRLGRPVTRVEIVCDGDRCHGERRWRLYGVTDNRVVQLKTPKRLAA